MLLGASVPAVPHRVLVCPGRQAGCAAGSALPPRLLVAAPTCAHSEVSTPSLIKNLTLKIRRHIQLISICQLTSSKFPIMFPVRKVPSPQPWGSCRRLALRGRPLPVGPGHQARAPRHCVDRSWALSHALSRGVGGRGLHASDPPTHLRGSRRGSAARLWYLEAATAARDWPSRPLLRSPLPRHVALCVWWQRRGERGIWGPSSEEEGSVLLSWGGPGGSPSPGLWGRGGDRGQSQPGSVLWGQGWERGLSARGAGPGATPGMDCASHPRALTPCSQADALCGQGYPVRGQRWTHSVCTDVCLFMAVVGTGFTTTRCRRTRSLMALWEAGVS